tara:strand:- start:51 stop:374 length:324 start_codon:yes stop_codon:yes gene_type:complete
MFLAAARRRAVGGRPETKAVGRILGSLPKTQVTRDDLENARNVLSETEPTETVIYFYDFLTEVLQSYDLYMQDPNNTNLRELVDIYQQLLLGLERFLFRNLQDLWTR